MHTIKEFNKILNQKYQNNGISNYKQKYVKYKSKYLQLKKNLEQSGGSILLDSDIDILINKQIKNIKQNIRDSSENLILLDLPTIKDFLTKISSSLNSTNELGKGQYGIVYDLSPSYVLKKINIMQKNFGGILVNKTQDILTEIKTGFFVEFLNKQIDLYSGNLAFFEDGQYYYIIMKKYKNIDILDKVIGNNNIIDISISFICQLFIMTLFMKNNFINHGDEKFDNLMFEETDKTIDNFIYTINGVTYNIKNCGFKLKLIDWGEAGNIISTSPTWDNAWIEGFKKGVRNIKKDTINKEAPTSDYLIDLSKILYLCELLLDFNDFDDYLKKNLNPISDNQMELFKYKVLIGNNTNNETLLKELSVPTGIVIKDIYNIFRTFYDTRKYNFLIDENNNKNQYLLNSLINFDINVFPKISYNLIGDTIKWNYCDINNPNIKKKIISYKYFIDNIEKIINNINLNNLDFFKIDSTKKPPIFYTDYNKLCTDKTQNIETNIGNLVSGITNFYIFDIDTHDINKDIDILKEKINIIFNTNIETIINITNYIKLGFDKTFLYVVYKYNDTYKLYIFKHSGLVYKKDDKPYVNHIFLLNYGGLCISNENSIKDIFLNIIDIASKNSIFLDLSPVGFYHYHLNYNDKLDMFFGVVHAKIETTSELGILNAPNGFLQYKFSRNSKVQDLTGDKDTLIKEHNFIFSVDKNNVFKLYNANCNSILHSGIGFNDSFFNTKKFAEFNYYGDIKTKSYVYIYKATSPINIIDYTKYNSCNIKENYTQAELNDIAILGLDINNYKKLRTVATHDEAKDILNNKPYRIDDYISYRSIGDHALCMSFL